MNLKKVISACTASMLGLSYLCSAFTVAAAEKKENLLILGDASSKGYEHSKTIVDIIEDKLDVNYQNLSDDTATTEDLLKKVKTDVQVIAEIKNSDSVVISAGGYDYLKVIMEAVADYTEYGDSVEDVRNKMIADSVNASDKIMQASKQTTPALNNLTEAVSEIKKINADAEVYIVSLYNPFKYDVEKYGLTNDPIIDAISGSVDSTLDTFNNQIGNIDGVYKVLNTNNAFNYLARIYKNVTEDATGLDLKGQFDLATKILAEITGETPASALSKVLNMIPAYLLPLLPDNFTVQPMTFDLGDATYDLGSNGDHTVTIDLSLKDNFGISAFQGDITIGTGKENFVCTDVYNDSYKGFWSISKANSTIQFSSADGHNIEATDEVLGQLNITIPENIEPGKYEVSLSNSSISVLTSKGQKNYKQTDDGVFKIATGTITIINSSVVTTPATSVTTSVTTSGNGNVTTPVSSVTTTPAVTTSVSSVTTTTTVTTLPDIPPITTAEHKSIKLPENVKPQDMVSSVQFAQFYYSYETDFSLDDDSLKVEAQTYDEKGEAIADSKINIASVLRPKNNVTPKSQFDLAGKKVIYNIPVEIDPEKITQKDGKKYVEINKEIFDVTEMIPVFEKNTVTFKAYIGLRGDIDLNFKVDTRDGLAAINEYKAISFNEPLVFGNYTDDFINKSGTSFTDEDKKELYKFTYFLGDASNNNNSDHDKAQYAIDTRDELFIIQFYKEYSFAVVEGNDPDIGEIWKSIEG